jgi:hypothetical protein
LPMRRKDRKVSRTGRGSSVPSTSSISLNDAGCQRLALCQGWASMNPAERYSPGEYHKLSNDRRGRHGCTVGVDRIQDGEAAQAITSTVGDTVQRRSSGNNKCGGSHWWVATEGRKKEEKDGGLSTLLICAASHSPQGWWEDSVGEPDDGGIAAIVRLPGEDGRRYAMPGR